ncbi:hypothetical protein LBBP_01467 [Leptospira borgpetersenii serovar Ballum]|uniref:Uncharacterized protein n=1 Tax=Leptospira borgpetersenii serovar Ballum TaxID=280505 RepID=A0A0S2IQ06_LEPBO|nr:hypothetical protein LBBP_01467 [Leptospira borgpetersenii serovar Ballum]
MLKNFIIQINKTALIDRFHETETAEELIFQLSTVNPQNGEYAFGCLKFEVNSK